MELCHTNHNMLEIPCFKPKKQLASGQQFTYFKVQADKGSAGPKAKKAKTS